MSEAAIIPDDVKKSLLQVVKEASTLHLASQSQLPSERESVADLSRSLIAAAAAVRNVMGPFIQQFDTESDSSSDLNDLLDAMLDLDQTLRGHVVSLVELARDFVTKPSEEIDSSKKEQALAVVKLIGQVARNLIQAVNVCAKLASEAEAEPIKKSIPVTVITGFLGSGKTTLLNYILTQNHGERIAVIENEFGEVGIDDALIKDKFESKEEIFEMNNGCICCTVRGDLIRILGKLLKQRDRFDYILIETTGLADPAPIAQTFFTVPEIGNQLRLDSIITVVDAKHITQHLDDEKPEGVENESVEQLAFADRVLLNKIDLVTPQEIETVKSRIHAINTTCEVIPTQNSVVDLDKILNLRAFDLDKIMTMDPEFLRDQEHMHDSSVFSVGILEEGEADMDKLNEWIGKILREMGADIFRMKGVIAIKGKQRRYVFQGVHMLFGGSPQAPWGADEKKINKMVFIGRNLDRKALIDGFKMCLL